MCGSINSIFGIVFRWCALDCGYVGRAGPWAVSEKPAEGSFAVHGRRTGLLSSAEPELGTHSHGLEHLSDSQPIAIALVFGGLKGAWGWLSANFSPVFV